TLSQPRSSTGRRTMAAAASMDGSLLPTDRASEEASSNCDRRAHRNVMRSFASLRTTKSSRNWNFRFQILNGDIVDQARLAEARGDGDPGRAAHILQWHEALGIDHRQIFD